jgi:tetratricopeptide (TPR) repeat protein
MNNVQQQSSSGAEKLRPVLLDKRPEPAKGSRSMARAVALHLEGKKEEALKELHRAISKGDTSAELHSAMGHIQYELGQFDGAVESYRELLRLQPKNATAWFNMAVCLENLTRWQEAAEKFKTAADLDANGIEAQLGMGICHLHLNAAAEALAAFEKCLAKSADNDDALFGKAVALQLLNQLIEAVEIYRAIIERNPESEESLSNLIAIGMTSKDYEMVRENSETLLGISRCKKITVAIKTGLV